MEENKRGNAAIVVILVVIILGLVGFIVYDKVLSKKTETRVDEPTTTTNKSEEGTNDVGACELYNNNGFNIVLKNNQIDKDDEYIKHSDIYVNGKFVVKASYENVLYNDCGEIQEDRRPHLFGSP